MSRIRRWRPLTAGLLLSCLTHAAAAQGLHPPAAASGPERVLLQALDDFRSGDVKTALVNVQALVTAEPNFRLAQLVYGDLLAARTGVPVSLDAASAINRTSVAPLLDEARQRVRRQYFHPEGLVPAPLLTLAPTQPHVVLVDTALSRLYVFENREGQAELIADYYISAGKNGSRKEREGDRRTPLGVYFVTERLPGAGLPDKYGPVAFPVDYPNLWDRRLGRTGDGIWLHGVASNTYSRPPKDSDGCVALSNADIVSIAPLLSVNTPVVIAESVDWLSEPEIGARRSRVEQMIEQWRTDWEGGDTDRYLSHYSKDFYGRGMNRAQWDDYKRRVNTNKKFIRIGISDLSVFQYPEEDGLMVVSFRQQYESNSFKSRANKRQYWRQDPDGQWRIISEEAASAG